MKKRSGEIDLLRFLFSMLIVLHHFDVLFPIGQFAHGYIAVEFFFVVTGFLMARHAKRFQKPESGEALADSTWKFIIRKIGIFFPYYICAVLLQLIIFELILDYQGLRHAAISLLESIPTFSLTFLALDFPDAALYVGSTWYLSAMIIALFILYPILLRFRDVAGKLLFPLISLLLLGYLNHTQGSIAPVSGWTGFYCHGGVLRAIAEIALGASLCSLSDYMLQNSTWQSFAANALPKLFLTLVKIGCYGAAFWFAKGLQISSLSALLLLAIGVLLSFSNAGYTVPDHPITRYLGRISLPIFIFHGICRWTFIELFANIPVTFRFFSLLVITSVLFSIIMMYLVDLIKKLTQKIIIRT